MIEHVRELIADMPQPDQFKRTAAFFGVVVAATEIPENEAYRAFLHFLRTKLNRPFAGLHLGDDQNQIDRVIVDVPRPEDD